MVFKSKVKDRLSRCTPKCTPFLVKLSRCYITIVSDSLHFPLISPAFFGWMIGKISVHDKILSTSENDASK